MDTLPSAVTIIKKKSKTYMGCCCRSIDKVISIVLLLFSVILLAVACGTQNWIQFTVRNNATEDRGLISLGLLRGSHSVRYGESPIANFINGSYFLMDKFSNTYLGRFYGSLVFSVASMVISVVGILVTLVNSYQTVSTWWKGPPMIYLLSYIAGFFGVFAVVLFVDYYLWAINTSNIFVSVTTLSQQDALVISNLTLTSFEYLITDEGYRLTPMLHFSFGLEVAGACLPLIVTLVAWRMALNLPEKKTSLNSPSEFMPLTTQSGTFLGLTSQSGTFLGVSQNGAENPSFNYEKVTHSKSQGNDSVTRKTKKVSIASEFLY